MKEIRYYAVKSWTTPEERMLLMRSKNPITIKELEQARIDLIDRVGAAWKQPTEDYVGPHVPKYHIKLKELLRQVMPANFELLEVPRFVIV